MFKFSMLLGMSTMMYSVYAMETLPRKESKSKPRRISLSLPTLPSVTLTSSGGSPKISPNSNSSPKVSPNLSANPSPSDSPRSSPKFSPKKNAKNDLRIHYQDYFENSLWEAVKNNDTETALGFIQPNMDISDKSGKSIFIKAIKNENEILVKSFLKQENIDVNLADKCGNTPLHHAVLACNEVIIKLLLHDYRINSCIQNANSRSFPHDLADGEFYLDKSEFKKMLIARVRLDTVVYEKAISLSFLQDSDEGSLDTAIAFVRNLINKDQESLAYATDEFIKKMMVYRIAEYIKTKNKA